MGRVEKLAVAFGIVCFCAAFMKPLMSAALLLYIWSGAINIESVAKPSLAIDSPQSQLLTRCSSS